MTPDKVRRLDALASQLSEALMTAAICAREIHAVVRTLIDSETPIELSRGANGSAHFVQDKQRPLLDESTLSVIWNDIPWRATKVRWPRNGLSTRKSSIASPLCLPPPARCPQGPWFFSLKWNDWFRN